MWFRKDDTGPFGPEETKLREMQETIDPVTGKPTKTNWKIHVWEMPGVTREQAAAELVKSLQQIESGDCEELDMSDDDVDQIDLKDHMLDGRINSESLLRAIATRNHKKLLD